MASLWKRRSVIVFFLVGFGLPWLGWTTIAVSGVRRPSPLATMLFYTGDFMTVAGFVATFVAAGRSGLLSLLKRYIRVRASLPWMLFALLLPMVWYGLAAVGYGATHGGIGRFEPAGLLQAVSRGALIAWTTGPLGEEAGWRGFFLPRLTRYFRPIGAALILGVIWSIWHYPLYYNSVFASPDRAINFTIGTICFSLLMAVLWAYTNASVFWAIVLHWSINVTPNLVSAMFPDIQIPSGVSGWLNSALLIVVTVIVALAVGLHRLQRKLEAVVETLGEEAIDADRSR